MKIAIFYSHLTAEGGAARVAVFLARSLQKINHQVIVFCFSYNKKIFPEICRDLDIRIVSPRRPFSSVSGADSLWGKLKQKWQRNRLYEKTAKQAANQLDSDFDAINCQDDYSYKVGFFYKKRNPKAKIIWTMYNLPFIYIFKGNIFLDFFGLIISFIERLYEKKFLKVIDLAITLDFGNKELVQALGVPVQVLSGGVDFNSFYFPLEKRRLPKKEYTFLTVGSLVTYRRFEDTILAAAILRERGYNVKVLLITQDDGSGAPYLNKLREVIKNSKMEKHIHFFLRNIPEEEFKKVYQQSDFFIFPNHIRIWGLAAFEAMASGLPLIVSRATSVAEVLQDGHNALFIEPIKPDDIADKVEMLINDPKKYYSIAEAGQQFVEKNLDWQQYADRLLKLIVNIK